MKKALINDWYYVNGGAEKVIHSLNAIWDDFDHFALIDFLNQSDRDFILNGKSAATTFVQKLPTAKSNHRKFLQLFPSAMSQFDLSEYDLVFSSSSSIAKGVRTKPEQLHICYCHSPMRYAWDLQAQYLQDAGLHKGLKGKYAQYVLRKMRQWDLQNSPQVSHFIANSKYVAQRIKSIYQREATVIYPPVNTSFFTLQETKKEYFFTASRMVSYKKIQLIVEAFNAMPHHQLIVAGTGPELDAIQKIAKSNIQLVGFVDQEQLKHYLQNARAFVFAAEEDFGIVPVEAQACGTPIIAFGKGGVLETVIPEQTGLFFQEQTASSIQATVNLFETKKFDAQTIRKHAEKFSKERFEMEIKNFVTEKYALHQKQFVI